jgi:Domain of unknown function (DUF4283)
MSMWWLTYLLVRHPLYTSPCNSLIPPYFSLKNLIHSPPPRSFIINSLLLKHKREGEIKLCYHYDNSCHLSSACRDPIVYFTCDKVGHHSWQCRSAPPMDISRPPLSLQSIEEANCAPLIKLYSNDTNKKFLETLRYSLVIQDFMNLGLIFIQSHLHKLLPLPVWQWISRSIDNSSYLIESPNNDWCRRALAKSHLILGDIIFSLAHFDPSMFDKGRDLVPVWIQVVGLSYHLWQDFEFRQITDEIGGILLNVDPRSVYHIYFTLLRLHIGVSALELV